MEPGRRRLLALVIALLAAGGGAKAWWELFGPGKTAEAAHEENTWKVELRLGLKRAGNDLVRLDTTPERTLNHFDRVFMSVHLTRPGRREERVFHDPVQLDTSLNPDYRGAVAAVVMGVERQELDSVHRVRVVLESGVTEGSRVNVKGDEFVATFVPSEFLVPKPMEQYRVRFSEPLGTAPKLRGSAHVEVQPHVSVTAQAGPTSAPMASFHCEVRRGSWHGAPCDYRFKLQLLSGTVEVAEASSAESIANLRIPPVEIKTDRPYSVKLSIESDCAPGVIFEEPIAPPAVYPVLGSQVGSWTASGGDPTHGRFGTMGVSRWSITADWTRRE
jgi:hypothetical protein